MKIKKVLVILVVLIMSSTCLFAGGKKDDSGSSSGSTPSKDYYSTTDGGMTHINVRNVWETIVDYGGGPTVWSNSVTSYGEDSVSISGEISAEFAKSQWGFENRRGLSVTQTLTVTANPGYYTCLQVGDNYKYIYGLKNGKRVATFKRYEGIWSNVITRKL